MKFNPDDPKWTAYVLGELSAADRAAVEKELESSADARDIVEDIRMTTSFLKDELANEASVGLQPDQVRTIQAAAAASEAQPSAALFNWRRLIYGTAFAAAASLMIAMVAVPSLFRTQESARVELMIDKLPQQDETSGASSGASKETTATAPLAMTNERAARLEKAQALAAEPLSVAPTFADANRVAASAAVVEEREKLEQKDFDRQQSPYAQQVRQQIQQGRPGQQGQQGQEGQRASQLLPFRAGAAAAENQKNLGLDQAAPGVVGAAGGGGGAGGGRAEGAAGDRRATPPSAPAPAAARAESDRLDRLRANIESYDFSADNPFIRASQAPLATFSIDVDTASYASVRRFLNLNQLPPKDSVRIEEMINYFTYDYAPPTGQHPIAAHVEVAAAPWKPEHRLVRVGIKGKAPAEELSGAIMTIAKDVKIQIVFNPAQVDAYRLIGYENRILRHQDFNDDQTDAADMGSGHSVTALFEVAPRGVEVRTASESLRDRQAADGKAASRDLLSLQVRYKEPADSSSKLMEVPVSDRGVTFASASADFRFAAGVAFFGMVLRNSPLTIQSPLDLVIDITEKSRGGDRNGYRDEFIRLVRRARALKELQ